MNLSIYKDVFFIKFETFQSMLRYDIYTILFFSPICGHSIRRPLATTKARSGDLFIMGAPDRQATVAPYEGTDSFTSMPYPGFEPGTLGVAVGCPIHYTSWSVFHQVTVFIYYFFLLWSIHKFYECGFTRMLHRWENVCTS